MSDSVLYVIGGPARVGKSTVARTVAARAGIGWVSGDALSAIAAVAGVSLESRWSVDDLKRQAAKFFPFFRAFAESSVAFHGPYVIEGISILPEHVAELADAGLPVRACFLGDESVTGDDILSRAEGFVPDGAGRQLHLWVRELSAGGRDGYAREVRSVSAFFRSEAERFGYPYIDMGSSFERGCEAVAVALLGFREVSSAGA